MLSIWFASCKVSTSRLIVLRIYYDLEFLGERLNLADQPPSAFPSQRDFQDSIVSRQEIPRELAHGSVDLLHALVSWIVTLVEGENDGS